MGWWFSDAYQHDKVFAMSWVIWVIVSIVLHELGHGFAALRCGDDTPRALNRITLNPFVHIPGMAWIMFALFGFTWGLMPVNPGNFRGRYDDAKVAAAGPTVNLVLFIICALGAALWDAKATGTVPGHVFDNVFTFLYVGTFVNLMGVIFNLIPIPPLDGSAILSNFSAAYARIWTGANAHIIGLAAFAFLFFVASKQIWPVVFRWSNGAIVAFGRLF
jgi:Zn-dependent protease